jgi:flagellar protein FlaG
MSNELPLAATGAVTSATAAPLLGSGVPRGAGDASMPVQPVIPVIGPVASGDPLRRATEQVVAAMPGANSFKFSFDKQSGMTIVEVYNQSTGQLVRQIPTEEIVRIAQLMRQDEAHPQVIDLIA